MLLVAYLPITFRILSCGAEIASSDLVVLEDHVVYSLSDDKSAAQFFMMQYSQSFDLRQSVPLEELVVRLVPLPSFLLDNNVCSMIRYQCSDDCFHRGN